MLVNTFFEWEGKRWQLARKEINPFFAHNSVGDITLLDDIMTYFIARNLGEELPIFNKEDARMIKKMEPFCQRVIDWNRDVDNKENPA